MYEVNKNVIEEFTVPALLIDLNMNVVAKNLRARRYLRTLRLGNTVKGVISEGDVEDMQRMKIGDRMRISMLVVGDMFGGIVQRCYDCYAVQGDDLQFRAGQASDSGAARSFGEKFARVL